MKSKITINIKTNEMGETTSRHNFKNISDHSALLILLDIARDLADHLGQSENTIEENNNGVGDAVH